MTLTKPPYHRGEGGPFRPLRDFMKDQLTFCQEKIATYGRFFELRLPFRNLYITTDLAAIRHVLQANQRNYHKSPLYRQLELPLGKGLLTSEGNFWKKQRRLAQPAFYKQELQLLYQKMVQESERICRDWKKELAGKSSVDISYEMMSITADIVLQTLFSSDNKEHRQELYRLMTEVQEYVIDRGMNLFGIPWAYISGQHRRFLRDREMFDSMIYEMIDERESSEEEWHDLLQLLLHSTDAETGERMNRKQLRDEMITLFAAGHETSANALAWMLYLLAKHPDLQEQLRKELLETFGGKAPTMPDLKKVPLLERVVQEVMRLYPPAYAVGREAQKPDEILGYSIPSKSIVYISIYTVHRDAEYWEKPDAFWPDHFLPEKVKARPRLAYLPFGAGPRMCIGYQFAMMEMQILAALLVQQFSFEIEPGYAAEKQTLITLKPKDGMHLRVKPVQ
ncbi:MAG: cytochrome P450 [Bacteroidota bacterium]